MFRITDEEDELVQLILTFARSGFPLTKRKVRSLAHQFARLNGITGFSCQSNKAGKKWLKLFLKRHPVVRVKRAHNLSVNRAMCANPTMLGKFFDQYKGLLESLDIRYGEQIWNCDESGVTDVPHERDVLGETGVKAYQTVSKEQGELSTVLTFANAAGLVAPPVIIHKGGKVQGPWLQGCPGGTMVRCSPNGWINKDIFFEYALRWIRFLRSWRLLDRKHILLLDAHKSHVYNLRFVQLMIQFDISVLCIPAHTSHLVQPLDSIPFASFKAAWHERILDYLFGRAGVGLPKWEFFKVFLPVWRKTMIPQNVQAGFRKTGIYPFNPDAINPKLLGPSQPSDNLGKMFPVGVISCYVYC